MDLWEQRTRSNREALMSLLTGSIAQPLSGLAGLAGAAYGGQGQMARNVAATQQALTYQPRDPSSLNALGGALAPVTGRLQQLRSYLGDQAMQHTGSPALATGAYMVPDTLLSLLGARGAGVKGPGLAQLAERSAGPTMGGAMAQDGMIAYHGTPHRFAPTPDNPLGAFDMSKMGTGEGAQAYGHGHYLAGVKDTARSYRGEPPLDGNDRWLVDGQIPHTFMDHAAVLLGMKGKDEALKVLQERYDTSASYNKTPNSYMTHMQQQMDAIRGGLEPAIENKGNVYHVDIPDEATARFLNHDLPLHQQTPHVQQALSGFGWADENMTGGDFLRSLSHDYAASPADASARLKALGIPGVKYLDGGSRGAGAGSHNYVVFDDQLPKIIGRE
jgi:hypothetical protein